MCVVRRNMSPRGAFGILCAKSRCDGRNDGFWTNVKRKKAFRQNLALVENTSYLSAVGDEKRKKGYGAEVTPFRIQWAATTATG